MGCGALRWQGRAVWTGRMVWTGRAVWMGRGALGWQGGVDRQGGVDGPRGPSDAGCMALCASPVKAWETSVLGEGLWPLWEGQQQTGQPEAEGIKK